MPPAPSATTLKALAFGDDEFLFRYLGRWMQEVGDGGGRMKPLRNYDYDRVVDWLETLDEMNDQRSEYPRFLAARYFGNITDAVDPSHSRVLKIVSYLRRVGLSDPAREWQWLVWNADTAKTRLQNTPLIRQAARDLQSPELQDRSVPPWVRILPVRLYYFIGDQAAAKEALAKISPEDIAAINKAVSDLNKRLEGHDQTGQTPQNPPEPK